MMSEKVFSPNDVYDLPCPHNPLLRAKEEAQYQDESLDQAQQPLLKPPEHVHGRH